MALATTSPLHTRLRALALQRGLHRIGIEADPDSFPCRLLWRDSFTGESGTLCKFYPPKMIETTAEALRILVDLRVNPPKPKVKRKRVSNPQRNLPFSKAFLLSRELDRRAEEIWKRKAVAA